MASTDLIPAKVQEGKLIAALSLEGRVLANGVLPNSPPMERISLVKGMITGLLEKGEWGEAISLVYKDGSPARVLFDGDWEGLRKDILASAQRPSRRPYISENVAQLLITHNEAELLYDIACILPLQTKELEEVLNLVGSKISSEQMREGYNTLAARAEEKSDFRQAYRHYDKAENTAAISALYQKIFENFEPDNLDILLTIAEETNTPLNSRAAQTVYAVLNQPRLLRFSRDIPRRLMGMVSEYKLALSTSQDDLLKDALVSQLSFYELREWKHANPELTLRWAKAHAQSSPRDAYVIFRSRLKSGREIIDAVSEGLKNGAEKRDHYQGLSPEDIEEPHLRLAYHTLPLELKVTVALHLEDNALLQDLSRQCSRQKKAGSTEHAYRLWIYGQGDQQDSYVEGLRDSMIKKVLKDGRPSASLFLPDDTVGNRRWYLQMVERDPEVAYDIAKRIDDPALISEARILIIKKSPLDALHKFQNHRPEDTDAVGVNMALDALAKQYGVPREKIDGYLALRK